VAACLSHLGSRLLERSAPCRSGTVMSGACTVPILIAQLDSGVMERHAAR
jgi:hypothetical protein